jgi:hypothetical protein
MSALNKVVTASQGGDVLELIDDSGAAVLTFTSTAQQSLPTVDNQPTSLPVPRPTDSPRAISGQAVRVRNSTGLDISRYLMVQPDGQKADVLNLPAATGNGDYLDVGVAYADTFLMIDAGGHQYFHWPNFAGLKELAKGKYTYDLTLVGGELKVALVKDA